MEWLNEKIEYIEGDRFLYKTICFFLGGPKKRLTYKELYLILYHLNKFKLGENESKRQSMNKIIEIYSFFKNKKKNDI